MRKKLGALIALGAFCFAYAGATFAQTWSLLDDQRRAYLYYYAPIIFKRANENANGHIGRDLITNFNFDSGGTFNNNKLNWKNIKCVVYKQGCNFWTIRPTLYTAAIEFMDQGSKELVLIYHIYHALDQNAAGKYGVHDWERVEIHLKGIVGSPGSGEFVNHAVVTQHKRHLVRTGAQAQFLTTSTGKHLMVWQAEWSGAVDSPHGNELRFVQDTWAYTASRLANNYQAEVDVNGGDSRKNVHYVFVPQAAANAVSTFSAQAITWNNANLLASGNDNGDTLQWSQTKRVTYELQDLADIMATHSPNTLHTNVGPAQSWRNDHVWPVVIQEPMLNEAETFVEMPQGFLVLNTGSADVEEDGYNDEREGYPGKSWWWGCYQLNDSAGHQGPGSFCSQSFASSVTDGRGRTRSGANGGTGMANVAWAQHDYFVHFGYTDGNNPYHPPYNLNPTDNNDPGFWLPGEWYREQNGGFDGRWVQLFTD
jgi:hypothetical protein